MYRTSCTGLYFRSAKYDSETGAVALVVALGDAYTLSVNVGGGAGHIEITVWHTDIDEVNRMRAGLVREDKGIFNGLASVGIPGHIYEFLVHGKEVGSLGEDSCSQAKDQNENEGNLQKSFLH
jgi:hypothetical protein